MSEALLLASALYWGFYVIAVLVAIPCALALLFGIMQTARWFLRGGVNHLPGRHTSMTRREKAAAAAAARAEASTGPGTES